ncbi:MAG: SHOCT domain-containing protein [Burkholderiales bacterium]|nr:SHOCT domain-containing protein [Burkholderiales bacterium]
MFANKSNNELAIKIKEYIEGNVRELQKPSHVASQSTTSLADELKKLASLRDGGILSEQEFQTAKIRLIS